MTLELSSTASVDTAVSAAAISPCGGGGDGGGGADEDDVEEEDDEEDALSLPLLLLLLLSASVSSVAFIVLRRELAHEGVGGEAGGPHYQRRAHGPRRRRHGPDQPLHARRGEAHHQSAAGAELRLSINRSVNQSINHPSSFVGSETKKLNKERSRGEKSRGGASSGLLIVLFHRVYIYRPRVCVCVCV